MKLTFENEAEQLEYELGVLIDRSRDFQFTDFLNSAKNDLAADNANVLEIRKSVISAYDIYVERLSSAGMYTEPLYFKAVYGSMETPEIKSSILNARASSQPSAQPLAPVSAQTPVPEESPHVTPEQYTQVASPYTAAEQGVQTAQVDAAAEQYAQPYTAENTSEQYVQEASPAASQSEQYSQGAASSSPQSVVQNDPVSFPQAYVQQNDHTYYQPSQPQAAAKPIVQAKGGEYAIGAIAMSILGSVFLLTGLVYFAVNFLDSFAQGMVMYLICGIVLGVSEYVVRKVVPKLSAVFTAIGISGVYLSTVVNYRSLHNFNLPVTAIILAVCAVLVCLFGFKRKSQLYSLIGFLAAFISTIAIAGSVSPAEFLIISIGTVLISLLWLVFPVENHYAVTGPIMITAESVFLMATFAYRITDVSAFENSLCRLIFAAFSWIVLNLILYISHKWSSRPENAGSIVPVLNTVLFVMSAALYSIEVSVLSANKDFTGMQEAMFGLFCYLIFVIPCGIFAYIAYRKNSRYFIAFFVAVNMVAVVIFAGIDNDYVASILLVSHALFIRYFTRIEEKKAVVKIVDLLVQIVLALAIITFIDGTADTSTDYIVSLIFIAGGVIGLFIGKGFKTAVQIIMVLAICAGFGNIAPDEFSEAIEIGILLLFTFLTNMLRPLKTKHFRVFNWFSLIFMLLLLLSLRYSVNFAISLESTVIFLIGAIFGLAIMILLMNRDFGMPFAEKYIAITAYLTYVTILIPLDSSFVRSIILMGVGLVSVVVGFILKDRGMRIFGLILSMLTCGKIALIDFITLTDVKSKAILYILVGFFALLIGCTYMVLEVRENKKNSASR